MKQQRRAWRWVVGLALLATLIVGILSVMPATSTGFRTTFGRVADAADDAFDWISDALERRIDDPKTSPFEDVQWSSGTPKVKVEGAWYALEAVDGWERADLLAFIRAQHGADRLEKRFEEDLPQVLREGWKRPQADVLLRLKRDDGSVVEKRVVMTEVNRRRHWEKRSPAAQLDGPAVLDEIATILGSHHSYTAARGLHQELLATLKASLKQGSTIEEIAAAAMQLVAATGDGHADVRGGRYPGAGPWLDVLLVPLGHEKNSPIIAIRPDRAGFIDPARPRVLAINGVDIEEWMAAAARDVAHGSPQLVRERAARNLREAPALRQHLKLPTEPNFLTLTLASVSGDDRKDQPSTITASKPLYADWPRTTSRWLDDTPQGTRIGYVRLAEMYDESAPLRTLRRHLEEYGAGNHLILDLRGNSGGARDAINVLAYFLLPPNSKPVVYNAARPLLLPGESPSSQSARLASRFLYPATSDEFTPAERLAIAEFQSRFKPELNLPADRFGPWHFAAAGKAGDTAGYPGHLVVLMDERCFSAADVCLAALKEFGKAREQSGLPGITLMGQPSAGGSGLARETRAAGGAIKLRLSSMVSFMPDGRLFEGRGVTPDVLVEPVATDFITNGGDSMLERAVQHLTSESK